jgi:thiol-disulfide isomerase/thioredoxin
MAQSGNNSALSADEVAPTVAPPPTTTAKPRSSSHYPLEEEGDGYSISRKHRGDPAPDFLFRDAQGKETSLEQFTGRPVLVNLWATWCAPCLAEMPQLDTLARQYGGKITVLTISQDTENPAKVIGMFKQKGYKTIRPWLDPENQFNFHYNTGLLPTTILYDADGQEVSRVVGAMDWSGEIASMLVEEALNGV